MTRKIVSSMSGKQQQSFRQTYKGNARPNFGRLSQSTINKGIMTNRLKKIKVTLPKIDFDAS